MKHTDYRPLGVSSCMECIFLVFDFCDLRNKYIVICNVIRQKQYSSALCTFSFLERKEEEIVVFKRQLTAK